MNHKNIPEMLFKSNFKELILFLLVIGMAIAELQAQDYVINFAGTGSASNVENVTVQNLTQGTSLTITSGNQLRLVGALTGMNTVNNKKGELMKIYPNPATDFVIAEFEATLAGIVTIEVYDLSGRKVIQLSMYVNEGTQAFNISNLNNGIYTVLIKSKTYYYSGKIVYQSKNEGVAKIELKKMAQTENNSQLKSIKAQQQMQYNIGDRLLFNGKSGNYSNIISDIPTQSKTITFIFTVCTDGSLNNYSTVNIGTQVWMAENLKTNKYNDGTAVPLVTEEAKWGALTTPAYCWLYNDSATYSKPNGAFYNWYTVNTGKLCPTGWHLPSDAEWTVMENYLIANGYNYDGTTTDNKIAKSLASTISWKLSSNIGSCGNTDYPNKRNATGFTAIPSGFREEAGSFNYVGFGCRFWSSTEFGSSVVWARFLFCYNLYLQRGYYEKTCGLTVRCIKD